MALASGCSWSTTDPDRRYAHGATRDGDCTRPGPSALGRGGERAVAIHRRQGASQVTQYKIDVPEPSRDAAEWIGPVGDRQARPERGAGPARAARGRLPAHRHRGGRARAVPEHARPGETAPDPGGSSKPMATMCVSGEQRIMTSPGIWKVVGACSSDFSSSYGTGGYRTFGPSGAIPPTAERARRAGLEAKARADLVRPLGVRWNLPPPGSKATSTTISAGAPAPRAA